MPLTATQNGKRIEAPFVSRDDWDKLRKTYRAEALQMLCGQAGVPKNSTRGLQYFAHKPKSGCSGHPRGKESVQHLQAKATIAAAVRDQGWKALIEHQSANRQWVADVLADNGHKRIALEVQWSRQSAEEFSRRQDRYQAAGVKCFWFIHHNNVPAATTANVPFIAFEGGSEVDSVLVRRAFGDFTPLPLADVVKHVLAFEFRREMDAIPTHLGVTTRIVMCKRCQAESSVFYVSMMGIRSKCGETDYLCRDTRAIDWTFAVELAVIGAARNTLRAKGYPPPASVTLPDNRYEVMALCHRCSGWLGHPYFRARGGDSVAIEGVASSIGIPRLYLAFPHICPDVGEGKCKPFTTDKAKGPQFHAYQVNWAHLRRDR